MFRKFASQPYSFLDAPAAAVAALRPAPSAANAPQKPAPLPLSALIEDAFSVLAYPRRGLSLAPATATVPASSANSSSGGQAASPASGVSEPGRKLGGAAEGAASSDVASSSTRMRQHRAGQNPDGKPRRKLPTRRDLLKVLKPVSVFDLLRVGGRTKRFGWQLVPGRAPAQLALPAEALAAVQQEDPAGRSTAAINRAVRRRCERSLPNPHRSS